MACHCSTVSIQPPVSFLDHSPHKYVGVLAAQARLADYVPFRQGKNEPLCHLLLLLTFATPSRTCRSTRLAQLVEALR